MFPQRILALAVAVVFCTLVAGPLPALADRAVATGNGVAVWESDVQATREYLNSLSFHTTQDQYVRAAVRYVLLEAAALDLGLTVAYPPDDPFALRVARGEEYMIHLMKHAELDTLIIESYYNAFPGRFDNLAENDAKSSESGASGLTPEIAEILKLHLMHTNRQNIMREEYERLLEHYSVVIHGQGG